VVPPSRELPPPQVNATAKNPAWPVDPDVARHRKRTETKRKAVIDASRELDKQSGPITPDELNRPGTVTGSTGSNAPRPGTDPDGRQIAPSELGYLGGLFSLRAFGFGANRTEVGTFTNEPPRTTLTAPPPGYQTPSGAQPYGVSRRVERTKVEQFDPAGR
jgi:hypothetical protein